MQTRAFRYSLGIHGLILLVVLGLSQWMIPANTLRIDFSIREAREISADHDYESAPLQQVSTTPQKNTRALYRAERKQVERTVPSTESFKPEPQSIMSFESPVVVPSTQASTGQSAVGKIAERQHDPAIRSGSMSDAGMTVTDSQNTAELSKRRYLRQHFLYIRDLILAKLRYPDMARRMGWSGQVRVGFVVQEDGSATDVRVISSSGCELLDQSAVETVKQVSPFPSPPVRTDIVMPIVYRLN